MVYLSFIQAALHIYIYIAWSQSSTSPCLHPPRCTHQLLHHCRQDHQDQEDHQDHLEHLDHLDLLDYCDNHDHHLHDYIIKP